jgi:predicted nuclease with TOPRIM domain
MSKTTDAVKAVAILAEENDRLESLVELGKNSIDMRHRHNVELCDKVEDLQNEIERLKSQRRELVKEVKAWRGFDKQLQVEIGKVTDPYVKWPVKKRRVDLIYSYTILNSDIDTAALRNLEDMED